jgi:uncharacterized protein YqfB (UPF0267 family)
MDQPALANLKDKREQTVHELKCWPQFFEAIAAGQKRHDLRHASDREFQVGDQLRLREFDPVIQRYTGREQFVEVTYITSIDQPCALSESALHVGFCILSIALTDRNTPTSR